MVVQPFRLAIAVACSAVSVALAAPAHADANDQQYLDLVKAAGLSCDQAVIGCPLGDESMIAIGHSICRQLHGGNSVRSLGVQITRSQPNVQPEQAVKLVTAAEAAYCPEH